MKMMKFEFDYDYQNDSLFIYNSGKKSNSSVEIANMIVDYTSRKELSAIEVLNASNFFSDITDEKMFKSTLKNLIGCSISTKKSAGFLRIKFHLEFKEKTINTPVMIPSIEKSSPALEI